MKYPVQIQSWPGNILLNMVFVTDWATIRFCCVRDVNLRKKIPSRYFGEYLGNQVTGHSRPNPSSGECLNELGTMRRCYTLLKEDTA
jgi:hypothetical protein